MHYLFLFCHMLYKGRSVVVPCTLSLVCLFTTGNYLSYFDNIFNFLFRKLNSNYNIAILQRLQISRVGFKSLNTDDFSLFPKFKALKQQNTLPYPSQFCLNKKKISKLKRIKKPIQNKFQVMIQQQQVTKSQELK